jgi:hypothetical protein
MDRITRLAISPQGLAFDPETGDSFTLNPTGRSALTALAAGHQPERVAAALAEEFGVSLERAKRDLEDFLGRLRQLQLR